MGQLMNVITLGLGFLFLFIPFQTMSNIEKTLLTSTKADNPSYDGDAYVSLAVIYAVFALCNWITPSIITMTGPRLAMVLASFCYTQFILSFLIPTSFVLYVASAILGFGAALIWTGQGNYLIINSDKSTMNRNSGIFWALFECSLLVGNLFVFFTFQSKTHIDLQTRTYVYIILSAVSLIGIAILAMVRPPVHEGGDTVIVTEVSPTEALKTSFRLLLEVRMIFLVVTFFYTGLLLSFSSGVYGPCIGFTKKIADNTKQLVGLSGVLFGLGEVIGGTTFGILGKKTVRWGSAPVVIFGCIVHLFSFIMIYLNIPNNAPFGDTDDVSFIQPSLYVALLCSFLLGLGDSCFNTQVYTIISDLYTDRSAPAFALFKFVQSISSALSFVYSNVAGLYIQLAILIFFVLIGTVSFVTVERVYEPKSERVAND